MLNLYELEQHIKAHMSAARVPGLAMAIIQNHEDTKPMVPVPRSPPGIQKQQATRVNHRSGGLHADERHPTFDVPHDVPLTLHVTHTCAGSMLQTTALACTDAPPPAGEAAEADSASSLGASLTVRSGGLPPSKPGRPRLQPRIAHEL